MNNDLISRNALIQHAYSAVVDGVEKDIIDLSDVDNAPTVTDHSIEIAQKSIELGRSIGKTESKIENARPQGEWIKIFENPFTNGYVCPFCGHKIQVTEQFLPKVTECEACGADMRGTV